MLWQGRRESENVEDARGSGGGGRIMLGGGIGTVILVVLYLLLGGDPQAVEVFGAWGTRHGDPPVIDLPVIGTREV